MEPIKSIIDASPVVILSGILAELEKAELKHVWDPEMSIYEKVSILTEEAGEVANAANDKDIAGLKIELMQTAAMCIRILKTLK